LIDRGSESPVRRILVVGAHHGVGAEVVAQGRKRGLTVCTFEGDALDAEALLRSVTGQDAVVSTLGPRRDSPAGLCARGTEYLIRGMKARGVRRLVQVTGAIIGHPRGRLGLVYRLIGAAVGEGMLADRRKQEQLVMESGLDWTLLRPTRLTDAPGTGRYRNASTERVGALAHIARADVAHAALLALESPDCIGRAWTLQY
jgi:putative NADH-flavin reductase